MGINKEDNPVLSGFDLACQYDPSQLAFILGLLKFLISRRKDFRAKWSLPKEGTHIFSADDIQVQKASADLSENLGPRVHNLNGNCLIDFGTKLVLWFRKKLFANDISASCRPWYNGE